MTDQETHQAPPADDVQEEADLVAQLVESDNKAQADFEGKEPQASAQATSEDRASDDGKQTETKPDSPETSTERDPVTGRFLPKAKTQPEQAAPPAAPAPEQKQESEYAKAKKEEARQKSVLANFEKEKQEFRQWAEKTKRDLDATLQKAKQTGESRFNADEFERAAEWYDNEAARAAQEGDIDKFNQLRASANQVRRAAVESRQKEQQTYETKAREDFARIYSENVQKVIADNPDLGDPKSESAQKMVELLNGYPILTMHPEGFKWANEILQMRRDSAEVSGLREKVTKLEQENKELRERTSISGSGPAPRGKPENIEDMSMEEMDSYLTRKVHESDNIPVPA